MDIEQIQKLINNKIEAGNKVKEVRKVIKTYKTQKQDMYDDTAEILKPSIKVQKQLKNTIDEKQNKLIEKLQENKETVDKKQDEVIKRLKENQVELIKSVDVLSDIMSKQGSVQGSLSRAQKWVDDMPSRFDPLDIIQEADDFEEDDYEEEPEEPIEKPIEKPKEKPNYSFNAVDTEIIKKYGFDPTLENLPTDEEMKKQMASTTGKMNSKDKIIKNLAKKESEVLKKYKQIVKQVKHLEKKVEKSGTGIKRYNQPKRNAYKISQKGQYGGLVIDLPKLQGQLKVVAHKNGQKVYEKQADFDTLDLLTKRFNSKKNYSELARSVFSDLNRLSKIPIHRTSKKYSKLGSGVVYYNNPKDLLSRLELLGGSMSAGNNSSDVREEFVKIVHKLNKLNVINNKQVNDLIKEYLI